MSKELNITRYQSDNKGNDIFTFGNKKVINISWTDYNSVKKVPKKYMRIISEYLKACLEFVNSPKYMENLRKSFSLKL